MSLLYRLATQADLPRLRQLEECTFEQDRLSVRSFRRLIGAASAELVVADGEGELLGYALLLYRQGSSVARLYSLAISSQTRRCAPVSAKGKAARNCSCRFRLPS